MKKHPAIKFILITVVSGICGAVLSFLLSFQQAALISAIQSLSRLLGSALPALVLYVSLFHKQTAPADCSFQPTKPGGIV